MPKFTDEQWKLITERAVPLMLREAKLTSQKMMAAENQKMLACREETLKAQAALVANQGDVASQQAVNAALEAEKAQQQACAECAEKCKELDELQGQIGVTFREHFDTLAAIDDLEAWCEAKEAAMLEADIAAAEEQLSKMKADLASRG